MPLKLISDEFIKTRKRLTQVKVRKRYAPDRIDNRWADYEANYLHLENKTVGMLKSLETKITAKDDW